MARIMSPGQQKLHDRALSANMRLQKQLNLVSDGYWGDKSQAALIANDMNLAYDWIRMRAHFGPLRQSQVDGFIAIIDAANAYDSNEITPAAFAYMLATTWHETGMIKRIDGKRVFINTMQPVEEMGKGAGRKYGRRLDQDGSSYSASLPIYYGRGYVQLTWLINYVRMKKILNVDFVNHPELALLPKNAADIMITGMLKGIFTTKSLSTFIHYGLYFEFIAARRIINGTDKDDTIAEYAVKFLDSLTLIKK